MKKFYVVIGNPPYQEDNDSNVRKRPIYNDFMDASFRVGQKVELITPARFLFNAGQTPTDWNERMLEDEHLKVLSYEAESSNVFVNTDIKGGVAVSYHDADAVIGPIHVFTVYPLLNSIIKKIDDKEFDNPRLNVLFASQRLYKLSDCFFRENGDSSIVKSILSTGTRTKITSSFIEKMPEVFTVTPPPLGESVKFLARIASQRVWRFVQAKYICPNEYIYSYKLLIPEANNSGQYGEALADPVIAEPNEVSADTFLNVGPFDTRLEASNLASYYRSKFFRALLGARKVTQHSPSRVWEMIPLQDFTDQSDIDWSQSVSDIDRQLYRKYGLDDEEIEFIESHVKEMN